MFCYRDHGIEPFATVRFKWRSGCSTIPAAPPMNQRARHFYFPRLRAALRLEQTATADQQAVIWAYCTNAWHYCD
jgi:hypothetical protein